MTLRTLRLTPAEARQFHGVLNVRARVSPSHLEKVKPGVYRETDRSHCTVCQADDRASEIDALRARLAGHGVQP